MEIDKSGIRLSPPGDISYLFVVRSCLNPHDILKVSMSVDVVAGIYLKPVQDKYSI